MTARILLGCVVLLFVLTGTAYPINFVSASIHSGTSALGSGNDIVLWGDVAFTLPDGDLTGSTSTTLYKVQFFTTDSYAQQDGFRFGMNGFLFGIEYDNGHTYTAAKLSILPSAEFGVFNIDRTKLWSSWGTGPYHTYPQATAERLNVAFAGIGTQIPLWKSSLLSTRLAGGWFDSFALKADLELLIPVYNGFAFSAAGQYGKSFHSEPEDTYSEPESVLDPSGDNWAFFMLGVSYQF